MKKNSIINIAVMVVAIVLSSILATKLHDKQLSIDPTLKTLTKSPMFGFQKFMSDVEWMFFINYCGSQKSINKDNVDEVTRRIEKMISLDPNFEKIYTVAIPFIAIQSPEKAIKLLKQACDNPRLRKNYKIPFYISHIYAHFLKTGEKNISEILKYSEMAYKSNPNAKYIFNAIIRNKAALRRGSFVNQKHAELDVLFQQWKENTRDVMDAGVSSDSLFSSDALTKKILNVMQSLKRTNGSDSKVMATIEKVKKAIFVDKHLNPYTLRPYGPGEKFCSVTGKPLKVYGVCTRCGVVLHGDYCSHCGKKASK